MDDFIDDRRRVRRSGGRLGTVLLEVGGTRLPAVVRDFSVCGVGILSPLALETGASLSLEAVPDRGKLSKQLTAEVRHAIPMNDGTWLLGCRLSRYLNADDVLTLSGHLPL